MFVLEQESRIISANLYAASLGDLKSGPSTFLVCTRPAMRRLTNSITTLFFRPKELMEIRIRDAAIEDLPEITKLTIEAGSELPSFRYKYPNSHRYPEDTENYTMLEFKTYIEDTDNLWKWKAMVAEMRSGDSRTWKVISVAVWEVSGLEQKKGLELEQGQLSFRQEALRSAQDLERSQPDIPPDTLTQVRRDEDPARVKAWKDILDDARRKYLEPSGAVNGPLSYLHLQQLHTHPDYQYNGAGTALTNWGIELAKKQHLKIGMFASPMGELLFLGLKFTKLASIVVQVEGEISRVVVSCMALEPPT